MGSSESMRGHADGQDHVSSAEAASSEAASPEAASAEAATAAAAIELLRELVARRVSDDAAAWLAEAIDGVRADPSDARLFRDVSLVTRRLGKADLQPTAADGDRARAIRSHWDPTEWSVDQAARVALLLGTASEPEAFGRRLSMLCRTADVGELVAFMRGLPLYPRQDEHVARATEGVRTNMKPVFEAVAHRNPYPSERFGDGAWNQMVLKALFVEAALDPIVGLDARANPHLTVMLVRYAGERRAASRPISPELWRCIGHAPDDAAMDAMRDALDGLDLGDRGGIVLALRDADHPAAVALRDHARDIAPAASDAAESGRLTWATVTESS